MPRRLIQFIIIFLVLLLFVMFNLTNKCDISFGPSGHLTIKDAPVFLTVFASFILGMLCTLPFVFGAGSPKKNKGKKPEKKHDKPGLLSKAEEVSNKLPENDDYSDKKDYGID